MRQGDYTVGVVLGIKIKQIFLRGTLASTASVAIMLQKEQEVAHAQQPQSVIICPIDFQNV